MKLIFLITSLFASTAVFADIKVKLHFTPTANLVYQLDCISEVLPHCSRATYQDLWKNNFFKTDADQDLVKSWSDLMTRYSPELEFERPKEKPNTGRFEGVKLTTKARIASFQSTTSKPIYGTPAIPSKNFTNHQWIEFDGKTFSSDPYSALPPLFSPDELESIDSVISENDQIRNGGAAMMAYCKSQYSIMSDVERAAIRTALLKYCELDTLAMVMLVEYWRDVCRV